MKQIFKEARKDAHMVHKTVRLQMSFLHWMKSYDMKSEKANRLKEKLLNVPEVGIRDTVATAYDEKERQFYWKTFHDEYVKLNSQESVIP